VEKKGELKGMSAGVRIGGKNEINGKHEWNVGETRKKNYCNKGFQGI